MYNLYRRSKGLPIRQKNENVIDAKPFISNTFVPNPYVKTCNTNDFSVFSSRNYVPCSHNTGFLDNGRFITCELSKDNAFTGLKQPSASPALQTSVRPKYTELEHSKTSFKKDESSVLNTPEDLRMSEDFCQFTEEPKSSTFARPAFREGGLNSREPSSYNPYNLTTVSLKNIFDGF